MAGFRKRPKWLNRMIKQNETRIAGVRPPKINLHAPYKNSWEKAVADFLEAERAAGKWVRVHYERASFAIVPKVDNARAVSYLPDFVLLDKYGRIHFIEVKGHMRPGAENKLKALREMFPTVPIYIAYIERGNVQTVPFHLPPDPDDDE